MDWQYIAGFFDGEGHVGIHKSGREWFQHDITLANTHKPTIDVISDFLQSRSITHSIIKREFPNPKWKACWKIKITGLDSSKDFLHMIVPYAITKKLAIEQVLLYLEKRRPKRKWHAGHYANAIRLYKEGKSLRQVQSLTGMSERVIRNYAKTICFKMRKQPDAIRKWAEQKRSLQLSIGPKVLATHHS